MKMIVLLLFSLIFTGCTAKKLAVENADTLIAYQVTKRLPLYSEQRDKLGADVDRFLENSKSYAREVLPVIDELDFNSPEKLPKQYSFIEGHYRKIAEDFALMLSRHLASLDKKQQKDFFETLDDENRELLKEEKEKRLDKIEDRFKQFLGSITGPQKQLVRDHADYFHARAKARLDRRLDLHLKFREIFKSGGSRESLAASFHDAFKAYQNAGQENNRNLEILTKILPTLTKDQREHFRRHAEDAKEMLRYFLATDY